MANRNRKSRIRRYNNRCWAGGLRRGTVRRTPKASRSRLSRRTNGWAAPACYEAASPSKAMVKTAELMLEMQPPDQYGLALQGTVGLDWERTVQRKDKVVDGLVNGLNGLMKARKVDVITGTGTITSPRSVSIDGREIRTGTSSLRPAGTMLPSDVPGGNLPGVITSDDVLDADLTMKALPKGPTARSS